MQNWGICLFQMKVLEFFSIEYLYWICCIHWIHHYRAKIVENKAGIWCYYKSVFFHWHITKNSLLWKKENEFFCKTMTVNKDFSCHYPISNFNIWEKFTEGYSYQILSIAWCEKVKDKRWCIINCNKYRVRPCHSIARYLKYSRCDPINRQDPSLRWIRPNQRKKYEIISHTDALRWR